MIHDFEVNYGFKKPFNEALLVPISTFRGLALNNIWSNTILSSYPKRELMFYNLHLVK